MKISNVSARNGIKMSVGFSSAECSHSISIDLEDGDDVNEVFKLAYGLVKKKTQDSILDEVKVLKVFEDSKKLSNI